MLDFVQPILKSNVLKLLYFHQLIGQDPSKRRRRRTLKPEAVATILQHVPQPEGFDTTQTLDQENCQIGTRDG